MDKLYIIDKENKPIEVTDLKKAIEQAESYSKYQLEPISAFAIKQQKYWQHFLSELQKLAEQHPELLK